MRGNRWTRSGSAVSAETPADDGPVPPDFFGGALNETTDFL